MIQICSIKPREIIVPGRAIQWHEASTCFLFVEAIGFLDIEWHGKKDHLRPGDIVIGKKISLLNNGLYLESIRGFRFEWSASEPDRLQEPFILREKDTLTVKIATVISPLFSENNYSQNTITEIGQRCGQFFNELYTKKTIPTVVAKAPVGSIDPRLITVNRYIRKHFVLPLTLQMLADLIQCNPVYLCNTYSRVFRISPIKHLQHLKMSQAQDWLLHTNWEISNIANRLGYVSSAQFADLFKRYYGQTPTKYRRIKLLKEIDY
ncbi:helix-turn-helix transcriptional regulator [Cohnella soli]|uniref:Helix-turn-helix transcriptional regulator n=1 Tax=Cohnella soli TaxID=425005 RepID=A0ABW0HSL4_9BACL